MQLKTYQENTIDELLGRTKRLLKYSGEKKLVFKSPTGSGKTIMMAEFLKQGEQKPFYVDFIIKLKDGKIGLLDTKSGFTQRIAGPKVEGLYRYIQSENKKGKKLFGGIVTNTDQRNYKGRWIYFDKSGEELKDNDFSNWEDLEL